MAPLLFRGMKGVNISCASPASTATCTSMDPRRSVARRSDASRAIDRQPNPHLRGEYCRKKRALNWAPPPPSKLNLYAQKGRKSTEMPMRSEVISPAASARYLLDDDEYADAFFDVFPDIEPLPVLIPVNSSRFRSAGGDESPALRPTPYNSSGCSSSAAAGASSAIIRRQVHFGDQPFSSSSLPAARFRYDDESPVLGPSASTKYGEQLRAAAAAALPNSYGTQILGRGDDSSTTTTAKSPGPSAARRSQSQAFLRSSSVLSETRFEEAPKATAVLKPSSSARTRDQVVVLRVSLHCRGCEAKVRKHLSRMEGVTSFSIDFATKKVTVSGDVTPLGVLSAISKVKNAQFWPLSPPRSSASS